MNYKKIAEIMAGPFKNTLLNSMQNLQNELKQYTSVDVNYLQVYKLITFHLMSMHDVGKSSVLKACLELFQGKNVDQHQISAIQATAQGTNIAGRMLKQYTNQSQLQYSANVLNVLYKTIHAQKEPRMESLVNSIFDGHQQQIVLTYVRESHVAKKGVQKAIAFYAKRYMGYQQHKTNLQLAKDFRFNKEQIDAFYQLHRHEKMNRRQRAIVNIYGKYIKNEYPTLIKYSTYQLIQHLMRMDLAQFDKQFNIKTDKDIKKLSKAIEEQRVHSIEQIQMRIPLMKYMECSSIRFELDENLKLDKIPNENIVSLFCNIEQKLMRVDGASGKQFIIVHRVSDNYIFKSMITDETKELVEKELQQFNDGQLYDVIARTYQLAGIEAIKMRYLCYNGYEAELTIEYPTVLASAVLRKVKIKNLNDCINLRNLYSLFNTYKKEDIDTLLSLKRIYSNGDTYQDHGPCLLQVLTQKNELEYVYIQNYRSDCNIIASMQLSESISHLKFLYTCQQYAAYDITLDMNIEFPANLRVFDVQTNVRQQQSENDIHYGTIVCPEDMAETLEKQLIHEHEVDE